MVHVADGSKVKVTEPTFEGFHYVVLRHDLYTETYLVSVSTYKRLYRKKARIFVTLHLYQNQWTALTHP